MWVIRFRTLAESTIACSLLVKKGNKEKVMVLSASYIAINITANHGVCSYVALGLFFHISIVVNTFPCRDVQEYRRRWRSLTGSR